MAGFEIDVKIEDAQLRQELQQLLKRADNLRPAMKDIGEYLLRRTEEHFEREEDPDGKSWAPWSPLTLMSQYSRRTKKKDGSYTQAKKTHTLKGNLTVGFERYAMGRKILTLSHRLRRSFVYRAARDKLDLGSILIYSAIQHYGGKAGRGRKVVIPARHIIGTSRDDNREIERIAQTYLRGR